MSYQRQTTKPLFDDIFWSRPERTDLAGKLLIVGGNRDSLKAPMQAYTAAQAAGVGQIQLCVPDILKHDLGNQPGITFLPSTSSGSLSKVGLNEIIVASNDTGGLLLIGDFGRSSQTTQLIDEIFVQQHGQITLSGDGVDAMLNNLELLNNHQTCVVLNPGQFQKLVSATNSIVAYKSSLPLDAFAELFHKLEFECAMVVLHSGHLWVKCADEISATSRPDIQNETLWQAEQAARTSTFLLQHPDEPFKAITSSVFLLETQ
ncbi:hypothetical protein KC878_00155 [Candidatus Saccharibacteria bacterium]|nr:hypothetical protein [Candidatus Saccharibacteria bacterium]MCB9821425.1 hypothetical protein [Candidatus Nomurabacteria bacterium]